MGPQVGGPFTTDEMILGSQLVYTIRTTSVAMTSSLKAEKVVVFLKILWLLSKIRSELSNQRNKICSMEASERETLLWLHTFHFMKRVAGERESLTFHHFLDYFGSFSLVARIINTPTSFIFRKCHLYLSKSFKNKHEGHSCIVANVCVH